MGNVVDLQAYRASRAGGVSVQQSAQDARATQTPGNWRDAPEFREKWERIWELSALLRKRDQERTSA